MLSKDIERIEREETMRQDADWQRQLKEAASTNLDHALAAANDLGGGRFAGVNPTVVVGSEAAVKYPQLPSSSPWSGQQPEPPIEPPLGVEINRLSPHELEPSVVNQTALDPEPSSHPVQDPGGAPSLPQDVEAPPPSSPTEQTND